MTTGASSGTKYCPGCKTEKPREEFSKNKRRHDGLTNYCRICWRAVSRAQYLKNRQKIAAKYEANREKVSEAKQAARRRRAESSEPQWALCEQCGLKFVASANRTVCLPCAHGRAIEHGTRTTYVRGCRCRPCTDAASENAVSNRRRRFAEAGVPDDTSYRRRCRRHGGKYEFVNKMDVFERDNWICQLCSEPINRDVEWPHPQSVSLDHRVPLSKGGDHTYDNVQCSHLRCNQSKQHKTDTD